MRNRLKAHARWVKSITGDGERLTLKGEHDQLDLAGELLKYARFKYADLRDADFKGANVTHSIFENTSLREANFKDANLAVARLLNVQANRANFDNANLRGASLKGDFQSTSFKGAIFADASIEDCDFHHADLSDINGARLKVSFSFFVSANFNESDLRLAHFISSHLNYASFDDCHLEGADFWSSSLQNAAFRDANLRGAELNRADLRNADFRGADLTGADLRMANLTGARIDHTTRMDDIKVDFQTSGLRPAPEGDLIGWGNKSGHIVKMLIPREAKRSRSTTGKCRAEYVRVLEIDDGEVDIVRHRNPLYERETVYEFGEVTYADKWDACRWNECSHGIHFFLTREEAENWT